jgi:hypothetical protein
MMKLTIKLFLLFSLIVVLIIVGISSGVINISHIKENRNSEQKIILTELKEAGNLPIIKFNVNDIVEDTLKKEISDSLNISLNGKILAVLNGEVSACINLKELESGDIQEGKDSILITVPAPGLCSAKINYNRSRIYDSNLKMHSLTKGMVETIFPAAENNLKAEAVRLGILDQAKENAKKVLSILFKGRFRREIVVDFNE